MLGLINRTALALKIGAQALLSPVAFGAVALVERDGQVLLARHSYVAGWLLPGGGIGRGEAPAEAVMRELREEIGLSTAAAPEFFGLYARKCGLATNIIAVYRIRDAEFDFKPNLEIRAVQFADPGAPPDGTPPAVRRRLAEYAGAAPIAAYW